jgi:hypothetical protein
MNPCTGALPRHRSAGPGDGLPLNQNVHRVDRFERQRLTPQNGKSASRSSVRQTVSSGFPTGPCSHRPCSRLWVGRASCSGRHVICIFSPCRVPMSPRSEWTPATDAHSLPSSDFRGLHHPAKLFESFHPGGQIGRRGSRSAPWQWSRTAPSCGCDRTRVFQKVFPNVQNAIVDRSAHSALAPGRPCRLDMP